MLWKIRTELADRPGALAELAARCGADDINILSLEVFTAETGAVDELVVNTGVGWTADDLAALAAEPVAPVRRSARARPTYSVTPLPATSRRTATDRRPYVGRRGARQPPGVRGVHARRVGPGRRAGGDRRPAHRRLDESVVEGPRPGSAVPELRKATVEDAEAVVAMHERCSYESRTRRYHVPMPKLTTRTARHLSAPAGGVSVVAAVGGAVIGMATAAPWEELGSTTMEVAVLVEDGWQGQGLGLRLLRQVVSDARLLGADRVVCMVQPENHAMLRTLERLRMRSRVVRDGDSLMVTVALSDQSLSHAVDRPPVQYRQTRATPSHRSQPTRSAGQPAREHALAALSALQPHPDRAGTADRDGADRGGRP